MLSMLQATLTLPGIAAIALALGMAIDANVLINERIREELRHGAPPQLAIQNGLRARMGDDSRLERHHADRRSRAARLRLRPGARLRGRALYRHPDVDVLGRVLLARPRQPLVRRQEEAASRWRLARCGVRKAATRPQRRPLISRSARRRFRHATSSSAPSAEGQGAGPQRRQASRAGPHRQADGAPSLGSRASTPQKPGSSR